MFAIRADTVTTSPLTQWLGGQHGEEEKSEGGEEDWCKEAPEEEVGSSLLPGPRLRFDVDGRVKRAGCCRNAVSAMQSLSATPV